MDEMNEEKIRIPIERRLKDCPFCGDMLKLSLLTKCFFTVDTKPDANYVVLIHEFSKPKPKPSKHGTGEL